MKPLILLGPTAAGKTSLGIALAHQLNGEVISADSMQVYRGLDIGTAKPALQERQGVPHHLIDIREPDEPWTVADFVEQTNKLTSQLTAQGKRPIIAGGTGLYLWTLLNGYSFPIAPADQEIRKRLEQEPASVLGARLATLDPKAAAKIHSNDKKRMIRALEVYELTGQPISDLQISRANSPPLSVVGDLNYVLIGLNLPRPELYRLIERRADRMIELGLIDEVRGLLAKGFSRQLPAFQALGYKEAVEFLDGRWTREQMIAELKKRTRHFARRQLTWFRRFSDVKWFPFPIDIGSVISYIKNL